MLRCIPRNFTYAYVRCIPRALRALILNFLLCRLKIDFLRDHQCFILCPSSRPSPLKEKENYRLGNGILLVAESVHVSAVRTYPSNAVAGHPPDIFIHAFLADGEPAAATPAERGNFSAKLASAIFCPASAFLSQPGQIGLFM